VAEAGIQAAQLPDPGQKQNIPPKSIGSKLLEVLSQNPGIIFIGYFSRTYVHLGFTIIFISLELYQYYRGEPLSFKSISPEKGFWANFKGNYSIH
jgi:hypothetical protein